MIIDKTFKAFKYIASRETWRKMLNGVHFKGNYAEATDGFILFRMQRPEGNSDVKEAVIPADEINTVMSVLPRKPFGRATVTITDSEYQIETVKSQHRGSCLEGDFPDLDKTLESLKNAETTGEIFFNVGKMLAICNAFKAAGARDIYLKLDSEPLNGVWMRSQNENGSIDAVLMPIRLFDEDKQKLLAM